MPFSNPIVGGTTLIRPSIHSPDYVAGVSGWTINKDGTAEFNDVTVRGDLSSNNYVPGVSGWHLDQDGDAEFNSIQIRSDGTQTPIEVGDDDSPQVVILTNSGLGIIALPTNRPLENLTGGLISGTLNLGLPSEAQTLQIFGPTSDGAGDRASIFLSSQNNDGSSNANVAIQAGTGDIRFDEDLLAITTPVALDSTLSVDGSITALADVTVMGNLLDTNTGIKYRPTQVGTGTANFAAVTQVDVAISFPVPFLVPPVVVCSRQNSPANSAKIMVNATGITSSGFTMRFNTGDGTAVTSTGVIGGYTASPA